MPDAVPGLFLGQSDKPEQLLFHRATRASRSSAPM
jgi:hypothetical protein